MFILLECSSLTISYRAASFLSPEHLSPGILLLLSHLPLQVARWLSQAQDLVIVQEKDGMTVPLSNLLTHAYPFMTIQKKNLTSRPSNVLIYLLSVRGLFVGLQVYKH